MVFNEFIISLLLLLAVLLIYFFLKWHYTFAFGLMKKTSMYERNKVNIEKIKRYFFISLKIILWLSLLATSLFCISYLVEHKSLEHFIIELWSRIPEGFWLHILLVFIRIAILIFVMRYILKIVFRLLEKKEKRTITQKRYNTQNVKLVYLRVHNMIKYTFVLGVVYRIIHFFPFLEEVSYIFLAALILFFISSLLIVLKEVYIMKKSHYKI
ncbi:hypothetical protein C9926_02235 [Sulfurovum lithotrophicum]|nr:hypothetical protein C9926_02235 [Sulfurovum lithotrophicum]